MHPLIQNLYHALQEEEAAGIWASEKTDAIIAEIDRKLDDADEHERVKDIGRAGPAV